DDEGGPCTRLALGRHRHPGHAIQDLIPDRRTAESGLHPVAGLLHVFDLDPARRLPSPQDPRGPDTFIATWRETEGPESMAPEVLGVHQAAGPAGRWRISVQFQSRDVLTAVGRTGSGRRGRTPDNRPSSQDLTMFQEGEVKADSGLWHLRGDLGHRQGAGNHMRARKDMPTGNQESGSGDAPAFGKDANDGRFEL